MTIRREPQGASKSRTAEAFAAVKAIFRSSGGSLSRTLSRRMRPRVTAPAKSAASARHDIGTYEIDEDYVVARDRATVVAQALLQIIHTTSPEYLRRPFEALLRDEFEDVQRQAIADRSLSDA